jgi:ribosome biogenesis GTPase A
VWDLYEKHVGEMLTPPRKEQIETFPELVKQEFIIKEPKTDIVFSGLGWITINDPGAKVIAYAPKGVQTLMRKSLI